MRYMLKKAYRKIKAFTLPYFFEIYVCSLPEAVRKGVLEEKALRNGYR